MIKQNDIVTHPNYPDDTLRVIEVKNGRVTAEVRAKELEPSEIRQVSDTAGSFDAG